jgi:hypothetical protein
MHFPDKSMAKGELRMTAVDRTTLAQSLIDTVAGVLGSQPGCRVTHEDGIVLAGTFTAAAGAGADPCGTHAG